MSTTIDDVERPQPFEPGDDLELLARYRERGDAEAFGRIAHRHAGAVYATCLRVLGDAARAEDAAQETFFRLLRRPSDVTRSVGAWLHRTATNVALDMLRSDTSRRRRELAYGEANGDSGEFGGGASHQASTWAELSPAIDQAISEMPEELRTILVEHYLLGRTQAELAEAMGIGPATICRRVKQGIEELRRRLKVKGIDAVPTVLAGLLCHVAARQAPAGVLAGLAKMSLIGPMDPALPGQAVRVGAKVISRASRSHVTATAGQQFLAGVYWVGVCLAVVGMLVAIGFGLARVAGSGHGSPGVSPTTHRSLD